MAQQRLEVPVATGVSQTLSRDLRHVALIFRTSKGPVTVAVPTPNIAQLVTYLVRAAQRIAAREPASFPARQTAGRSAPIELSGIEVAAGRSEGEAILNVKAGPISLGLAVEAEALRSALQMPEKAPASKKPAKAKKTSPRTAAAKAKKPAGRKVT